MPLGVDDISFSTNIDRHEINIKLRKFAPTTVYSYAFRYPVQLVDDYEFLNHEIQRGVNKIRNEEIKHYEDK